MAKGSIRRCPTCKVLFPTIDAAKDHYKKTSHKPLPYKCKSCERAYKQSSPLQKHIQSKHPHASFLYKCEPCQRVFGFNVSSLVNHLQSEHPHLPLFYCESCTQLFKTSIKLTKHKKSKRHRSQANASKTPTSSVIAQMDAIDLNSQRDDDDDDEDGDDGDTNINGCGSPKDDRDCDAQGDPSLAKNINHLSALLSGNTSKPLSSVSELTSPSPSSVADAGPSSSKLDKATALARAALRNRFAEMGATTGETIPLSLSNIWGPPRKANSSVSNLDGPFSVATNLTLNSSNSNEKEVNESNLPSNSLDNITRPLTCPGCRMDFKSFSGFVLHIENRLCMSSICHEIEDQLSACVTQFFQTLALSGRA